jgi:hypothetical protein
MRGLPSKSWFTIGVLVVAGVLGAFLLLARGVTWDAEDTEPLAIISPEEPVEPDVENSCRELGVIDTSCTDFEALVSNLATAPLAYNKPEEMVRGRQEEVSLVIDLTGEIDLEDELADVPGEVVQGETKVARHMSAELRGGAFSIDPQGLQKKLITAVSVNRWDWTVTPTEEGENQRLRLTVYVHIAENGVVSEPIRWKTFDAEIPVDVTTWDQVQDVVTKINPVFAFVVTFVGAGWAVFMWWRRKKWRLDKDG